MTVWLSKLRVSILTYHKDGKESQSVLLPAHTGKKVAARNVCQRVGGAAVKKKTRWVIRKLKERQRSCGGFAERRGRQGGAAGLKFTRSRAGRHGQLLSFTFQSPSLSIHLHVHTTFRLHRFPGGESSRSELRSSWVTSLPLCQESCLGYLRLRRSHLHLLATSPFTRPPRSTRLHASAARHFGSSRRSSVD